MKDNNEFLYKMPFDAPLNPEDSEKETYGCRYRNAMSCRYNGLPDKCAFASSDHICRIPPKTWPKRYREMVEKGYYRKDDETH